MVDAEMVSFENPGVFVLLLEKVIIDYTPSPVTCDTRNSNIKIREIAILVKFPREFLDLKKYTIVSIMKC